MAQQARNIGGVSAHLTAETGQWTRKLRGAGGVLSDLTGKARRAAGVLARTGAIAGGAVAAGLAVVVKQTLSHVDAMAKQADASGMSIERLQAMQMAAGLAGVSMGSLDKAIAKANRGIGEAALGVGVAKKWIDRLGLSVEELQGLSPDALFETYANRIRQLGSVQEQTAAAAALFGDRTGELLPLINSGANAISTAQAEIASYGATMDRVKAAKMEQANDAMLRAKTAAGGLATEFTAQVAPIITVVTNKMIELGKKSGGFGKIIEQVVDIGVDGAMFLIDSWQGLGLIWQGLKTSGMILADYTLRGIRSMSQGIQWLGVKAIQTWDWIKASAQVTWDGIGYAAQWMTGKVVEGLSWMVREIAVKVGDLGDLLQGSGFTKLEDIGRRISEAAGQTVKATEHVDAAAAAATTKASAQLDLSRRNLLAARESLTSDVVTNTKGLDQIIKQVGTATAKEEEVFHRLLRGERTSLKVRAELEALMAELDAKAQETAAAAETRVGSSATPQEDPQVVAARARYQELERLAQMHQGTLKGIWYEGLKQREDFNALSMQAQVKDVIGNLEQMTRGVASHNKAMFRINQAAGVTQAVMNAYEAFTLNLAKYPGPIGFGMGGIALAAGLTRAAMIASQTFGSKGSAAPSTAGSGGGVPAQTGPIGAPDGPRRTQDLVLREDSYLSSRGIADLLNDAQEQGIQIGRVRLA